MASLNITNSHVGSKFPGSVSDDSGVEVELGAIRSDTSQISQVTANLVVQDDTIKTKNVSQADSIEERYAASLAEQIELKRAQANHLEQRLTKQAQQQTERLGKLKQNQPRIFSFPATKRRWQNEVRKESNRLQQTNARLVTVRDIRDGMGPLIPRLQEISAAKLRAKQPDLARARDEALRQERAKMQEGRRKGIGEQEQKKARPRSHDLSLKNS
ncbi:hypothetical protein GCM10027277_57720 [Pseudoduganella ginsengisoli]|uniref:Conjugal transfer protein n=1 Tax=Pseudoduganella ginsengisoli TaxID=1462440 RepID=A0A6L6Q8S8_9BURK|nr:IncP plasmid survival protein KfrC family protein [Pseudoduganella ginsengisoli]MTW05864.1 hypothetical protein [Pseudoduganella ginsengisoli]